MVQDKKDIIEGLDRIATDARVSKTTKGIELILIDSDSGRKRLYTLRGRRSIGFCPISRQGNYPTFQRSHYQQEQHPDSSPLRHCG